GAGEGGATPVAQGTSAGSARSEGGSVAAAAATLEANSCLPPYTRFLDYWDGSSELAGDDGSGGHSAAAAAASLVCVATGGGRVKADRVLAMRASGGSGEGHPAELELQHLRWPRRSVAQVGPAAFAALSRSLVAGTVQGMCVCPAPPPLSSVGGGAEGGPRLGLRPGAATGGGGDDDGGSGSGDGILNRDPPYVTPVLMVLFDNGSVQCYTSPAHLAAIERERSLVAEQEAAAVAA
ncbi:unnamed protein product, partial [Scytosiphon promiscuus]